MRTSEATGKSTGPAYLSHPVEALLFDLDGTLVDSAPDLRLALNAALADRDAEPVGDDKVRAWVGNGARRLVERAVEARGLPASLGDRVLADFMRHYEARLCVDSRVYDGVVEALSQLRCAGYPLACVTNKPERFIVPLLSALGIDAYFPVIVGGDTLASKKPDPEPLRHAAAQLGAAAENVLMVGDSWNDVDAARAVPCRVACVDYGYNYGQDIGLSNPDVVLGSLTQLHHWLVNRP